MFVTGGKYRDSYYEVFVNPTYREMKSLPDCVRALLINNLKRIYVWDSEIIHTRAFSIFRIPCWPKNEKDMFNNPNICPLILKCDKQGLSFHWDDWMDIPSSEMYLSDDIVTSWIRKCLQLNWLWAYERVHGLERYFHNLRESYEI